MYICYSVCTKFTDVDSADQRSPNTLVEPARLLTKVFNPLTPPAEDYYKVSIMYLSVPFADRVKYITHPFITTSDYTPSSERRGYARVTKQDLRNGLISTSSTDIRISQIKRPKNS